MENALPSVRDLYAALPTAWTWSGAALATASLLTTLLASGDALRTTPRRLRTPTAGVLAVYPLVALASLAAVAVPRGQLAAEAAVQVVFACCFYQLFRLLLAYHREDAGVATLDLGVGPCCCWPCCAPWLPRPSATPTTLRRLRLLVLQLPAVQTLLYATLLLLDDDRLQPYLQPVALLSILVAVWGVSVATRLVADGRRVRAKFAAMQAVLVLSKLQALVARGVVSLTLLPATLPPPFSAALCANLAYDAAMLLEMAALSVWARTLYRPHVRPDVVGVCVVGSLYAKAVVAP